MDRRNNFNLIRLVAAFGVLFFHVYPLIGLEHDPLSFTKWLNFGSLSVRMFFIVSGFLLTDSLLRNSDILTFAIARALRIWPALIVATLFSVVVLGPLVTTDPNYWSHPATVSYLWSATIFETRALLPGVFTDNPVPVVNGSLWTLPYEVFCYGVLVAAFATVKPFRWLAVATVIFTSWMLLSGRGVVSPIFANVLVLFSCELGAFFSAGAVLRLFRYKGHVALDVVMMGVLVAGVCLSRVDWKPFYIAQIVAIPYLVIRLAYAPYRPFSKLLDKTDISYGLYLYAFPMTQVVVTYLGKDAGVLVTTIVSTLATVPLAVLSWYLVEKPALSLRSMLRNRKANPTVDDKSPATLSMATVGSTELPKTIAA
jgi:peptidoglycan/LPS O-acetylase OafA/YrhL